MIESFATPDEIHVMRSRMEQLLHEFDCSTSSVFSTVNQVFDYYEICAPTSNCYPYALFVLMYTFSAFFVSLQQRLTDDYFLESAENISFFFEGIYNFYFCVLFYHLSKFSL